MNLNRTRDPVTGGERLGRMERLTERVTGTTTAQRALAKDLDGEIPLYLLTDTEMDACREGGDLLAVGPYRGREAGQ
jgi:hypothetical protein